jgi:hypothetical protein
MQQVFTAHLVWSFFMKPLLSLLLAALLVIAIWSLDRGPGEDSSPIPLRTGPEKAALHWQKRLQVDGGAPAPVRNRDLMQALAKRKANPGVAFGFAAMGPGSVGGRIRALVIHPQRTEELLVGSVSGGIWKSGDGGASWRATADFLPNIAISSMIVDSDQGDRVYAGTGEGFFNWDAARGLGIYLSNDFGESWQALPSTQNGDFYFVNRLVRLPGSQVLLAATRSGIFRSADGGGSWQRTDGRNVGGRGYVDLKLDPSQPNRLFASAYGNTPANRGILRSTDGGLSFTWLGVANGLPATHGRIELGLGSDGVVYASIATDEGMTVGLYRSANHGDSFSKVPSSRPYIERQGWYDLAVAVDPSDSSRVYMAAVDAFKTENAGTMIVPISQWSPDPGMLSRYVHADIHAIVFHPQDPRTIYFACDGGLFRTTDAGESFQNLNNNLPIAQFYGMAVHPDGSRVVGGTQDNGSLLYYGDSVHWLEWFGGDGGYCAWDAQNPEFVYGSTPAGNLFGSANGGLQTASLDFDDADNAPFIQPFRLDPVDGNRMLVGSQRLWLSTNVRQLGQSTWQEISGPISSEVSAIAIDSVSGRTAYFGTASGTVYRLEDLGGANRLSQTSSVGFSAVSTGLAIDPADATGQTVFATFSGYGPNRVQFSSNGGQTWKSLAGDLPEMPLHTLALDPLNGRRVFLGSELGLWVCEDIQQMNPHWQAYDYGPAYTRIVELKFSDENTLWVCTHGRGMYRGSRLPFQVSFEELLPVDGDGDAFLDPGERASQPIRVSFFGPTSPQDWSMHLSSDHPDLTIEEQPDLPLDDLSVQPELVSAARLYLAASSSSSAQASLNLEITSSSGRASFSTTLLLGASAASRSGTFFDGAEGPALMRGEALLGPNDWAPVGNQVHSGSSAWFSADLEYYSDKSLVSPWMALEPSSVLSFWLYYDMEGNAQQYWDGMVLEARVPGGDWQDLGDRISGLPYDGQLFNNSTLAYRRAWSGAQRTWRLGSYPLGTLFPGQDLQFRFRVACDTAAANAGGGVWIDDIQVSAARWLDPPTPDTAPCTGCNGNQGTSLPQRAFLPSIRSGGEHSTLLGVINGQDQAVDVELRAFSNSGVLLGLQSANLPAGGKWQDSVEGLFGASHPIVAWVEIGSSQGVSAYAELRSATTRSAYEASMGLQGRLYLPHVAKNTGKFNTYLSAVNGAASGAAATLEAMPGGTSAALARLDKPYGREADRLQAYFGMDLAPVDWAQLKAGSQLAAMESFTVLPDESQRASLVLENSPARRLDFLHIAADTGQFWTGLVAINVGGQSANVLEIYRDAAGGELSRRSYALASGAKTTLLFDHNGGGPIPAGAAWLSMSADQDLIGYELFGSSTLSTNNFFAGLPCAAESGTALLFQHFEGGSGHFTGLVAINLADQPANLEFRAFDAAGIQLESVQVTQVAPGAKLTRLTSALFSAATLERASWVWAGSPGGRWAGFSIWGDLGSPRRETLSGLRAAIAP